MGNVTGKVIVITGASSGAGHAMAIELAKEGAKLVLAARREAALEEVAQACRELGAEAAVKVTDVKEMLDVYQLAKFAGQTFGGIDVWVNNAGVLAVGAADEIPAEVNEDVVRTNLLGYIHGAQAALPYFKKQNHGMLINNISVGGWIATPYLAAYSASKFGLRAFFEALKGELKAFPEIHICDLYPAFLDTPGIQHAANYTGRYLRPAPPVYDPVRVARTVVSLIGRPREQKPVGSASILIKMAYAAFPKLTRNLTAAMIRTYLKKAQETENTPGNVLQPVPYGTGIGGGWEPYYNSAIRRKSGWLLAGLAVIGLLAITRKH